MTILFKAAEIGCCIMHFIKLPRLSCFELFGLDAN